MTDAGPAQMSEDHPLNALEEYLYAGLADPVEMRVFQWVMLESDLYAVPEPDSPGGTEGGGASVLRPGQQLILRGVHLGDGRKTVTLFTHPRRAVALYGPAARIIAMKGRTLLEMIRDTVILLNPSDGRALLMEPEQVQGLLDQADLRPPAGPVGPVELTDPTPDQRPVALIARIELGFRGIPVDQAWLARARWPEAGKTGWFVDIRSDQPADEIAALFDGAIRGLAFGGHAFAHRLSPPGGEPGVGLRVI